METLLQQWKDVYFPLFANTVFRVFSWPVPVRCEPAGPAPEGPGNKKIFDPEGKSLPWERTRECQIHKTLRHTSTLLTAGSTPDPP
jgi:hypothetical protein